MENQRYKHFMKDQRHKHSMEDQRHKLSMEDQRHKHSIEDQRHKHSMEDQRHKHYMEDQRHKHSMEDQRHKHSMEDQRHKHSVEERLIINADDSDIIISTIWLISILSSANFIISVKFRISFKNQYDCRKQEKIRNLLRTPPRTISGKIGDTGVISSHNIGKKAESIFLQSLKQCDEGPQ